MARQAGAGDRASKASGEKIGQETLEVTDADAAFVLGKGGKTKMKIVKVSGCDVDLDEEDLLLTFRGTAKQRRTAKRYARCVMQQREGPVTVGEADVTEDCTVLPVPEEAIGFVTGSKGVHLRTLEDEYTVIMCFAEIKGEAKEDDSYEDLLIFGDRTCRRGAQLQVMSAVESKVPNYYLHSWRESKETYEIESDLHGDWGTSTMELKEELISYALGKKGMTRKKVARASNCVVQYLDHVVFMSGSKKQRQLAQEYLDILFQQLEGPMLNFDGHGREDCTIMQIPFECVGYVTGPRRETINQVEDQCGVLMFFLDARSRDVKREDIVDDGKPRALAILGPLRARKEAELTVIFTVEKKLEGHYTNAMKDKESSAKGFDVDVQPLHEDDVSYAIGAKGSTREKIARASGAFLQLSSNVALIAGDKGERGRCRDYLQWLLAQKDGPMSVDVRDRDDVTELELPNGSGAGIVGTDAFDLRWLEQETGTFCFVAEDPGIGDQRLLIFGHEEGSVHGETGRLRAEKLARGMIGKAERRSDWREDDGGRWGGGSSWHESNTYGRWKGASKGSSKSKGGSKGGSKDSWSTQERWPDKRQRSRSRSPRASGRWGSSGGKGWGSGSGAAAGGGGRDWHGGGRSGSWGAGGSRESSSRGGARAGSGPPKAPPRSFAAGASSAARRSTALAVTPPWRK